MSARRLLPVTVATLALALALALPASDAVAVQPEEQLADPALEARARELSKDLRCVVCDNQSIDDSDAQVAADMRKLVRERIVAGDSDDEIRDLLVSFYGEYVLLTPRFTLQNAFVWGAPPLALLAGLLLYRRKLRAAGPDETAVEEALETPKAPPLSAEEEARLKALLGDAPDPADKAR